MTDINSDVLAEIRNWLTYDEVTGNFIRTRDIAGIKTGTVAGTANAAGYVQIRVCGKLYYAHRLAWAFARGLPVPPVIDHRDRNKANNRLWNLRAATVPQNAANSKCRVDNSSGERGVTFHRASGLWHARVKKNGKLAHSTYHRTAEEAAQTCREARARIFGEFALGAGQ